MANNKDEYLPDYEYDEYQEEDKNNQAGGNK